MGFSSVDDMIAELTAGKRELTPWTKITTAGTTYVAGTWYDFSTQAGSPAANTYIGTTLVAQTPTDRGSGRRGGSGVVRGSSSPARSCRRRYPHFGHAQTVDAGVERVLDLGFVGEPTEINPEAINNILASGMIPVIAPIGGQGDP